MGDAGRVNILTALFDGRALTATELAFRAGVAPATASEHLSKLLAGGLLAVTRHGRNRYFRLASTDVARMLEGMMVVAGAVDAAPAARRATPRISLALRHARTCYDHLAGRLGVGLADSLVSGGLILLGDDAGEATEAGRSFFDAFGLRLDTRRTRRLFCRPCLDWSERRPHLAGILGAALCVRCEELGWIRRERDSRAVAVTPTGQSGFAETFGIPL